MKKYLLLALLFCLPALAKPASHSLAFFYGQPLPLAEMTFYPGVVVQPDHTRDIELEWLAKRHIGTYAYLSVGESFASGAKGLLSNPNWHSQVMDLTSTAWQQQLLTQAKALKARGFHGLFLDTLDSYHLLPAPQQKAQQLALLSLIQKLARLFDNHLVLNRGFELLPQLQGKAEKVVAEGLYSHYQPQDDRYSHTQESGQKWLLAQLHKAQQLGFKVQVIDYAKPGQRRAMADDIIKAGFTPWVADGHLLTWGTSNLTPVARKVLIPFDSNVESLINMDVHQRLATMLEYLGYIPDYVDISKSPLPPADTSLYAGVIVWAGEPALYQPKLVHWLHQIQGKLPLLLLGDAPEDPQLLQGLGAAMTDSTPPGPYQLVHKSAWLKGEGNPSLASLEPYPLTLGKQGQSLIAVKAANGATVQQATEGPDGMLLVAPWVVQYLPDGDSHWVIDPLAILQRGLKLQPIPAPDVTTESGRRIMTAHIDGDGFPSLARFPGQPYAAQVIEKEIIDHYKLPITVSVIQGEVGPTGMYPKISPRLEDIARDIFKKPWVEIASHTYSHPFNWSELAGRQHSTGGEAEYGEHLSIPGYHKISLKKEIDGSINYINHTLAPPGKKVVMMLWSGDAAPGPRPLQRARNMGVLNVNGGNTKLLKTNPSLSMAWPIGRPEGELLYQIYAPIMNENVYTNLWHGPFYGFKRVRETFAATGAPLRIKPFTIYYHFYSGANPAGLGALRSVYDYVLSHPNTPVHLSHYARMARDFYFSALAKDAQGQWLLSSRNIRTLRLPKALGFADIDRSQGLAGTTVDGRYLHLPTGDARIVLKPRQISRQPYLANANVQLYSWQQGRHIHFQAWAGTADLMLANAGSCQLVSSKGQHYQGKSVGQLTHFVLPHGDFRGHLYCEASQ